MLNYKDTGEQQAAARTLWTLAFDKDAKERIKEEEGCVEALEKLSESEEPGVKKAANGALWIIKGKSEKQQKGILDSKQTR